MTATCIQQVQTHRLTCDIAPCATAVVGHPGETIPALRARAAASGWRYLLRGALAPPAATTDGRGPQARFDICPAHEDVRRAYPLDAVIRQARERRIAILHMVDVEGKTPGEIAQILGVSRGRAQQLIDAARRQRDREMRQRSD